MHIVGCAELVFVALARVERRPNKLRGTSKGCDTECVIFISSCRMQ